MKMNFQLSVPRKWVRVWYQSDLFNFKFHTLNSKILKIPEFNLIMSHNLWLLHLSEVQSRSLEDMSHVTQASSSRDVFFFASILFLRNGDNLFWIPLSKKMKISRIFEILWKFSFSASRNKILYDLTSFIFRRFSSKAPSLCKTYGTYVMLNKILI